MVSCYLVQGSAQIVTAILQLQDRIITRCLYIDDTHQQGRKALIKAEIIGFFDQIEVIQEYRKRIRTFVEDNSTAAVQGPQSCANYHKS